MTPWDELFGSASPSGVTDQLDMRVVRRHRRPLLLVPNKPRVAAQCLSLYPAQRRVARLAKAFLRNLWRLGIFGFTAERTSLLLPRTDRFRDYLSSTITPVVQPPQFGILAGNPAGGTQRFII